MRRFLVWRDNGLGPGRVVGSPAWETMKHRLHQEFEVGQGREMLSLCAASAVAFIHSFTPPTHVRITAHRYRTARALFSSQRSDCSWRCRMHHSPRTCAVPAGRKKRVFCSDAEQADQADAARQARRLARDRAQDPQGKHELGARGEVRRHYKTLVRRHFKTL